MNDSDFDDLLRSARSGQRLPASFRQGVWRRIENAQAPAASSWYDSVLSLVARPWGAFAGVAVTISLGMWLGAITTSDKRDDRTAYIESINPFSHSHP